MFNTFIDLSHNALCRMDKCLLCIIHKIGAFVNKMPQTDTITEKILLIYLTLHNMSAVMLKEFALKIVKPYFGAT
jgi:hypothetical protein